MLKLLHQVGKKLNEAQMEEAEDLASNLRLNYNPSVTARVNQ